MGVPIPPNASLTWQEYQDLVAELYERMGEAGTLRRNITLPDKITGQSRQIDAWLELVARGHTLGMLIDAKKYAEPVDVRDVESVAQLALAVGACKAVIVCSAGWTEPAATKAKFLEMDLRLLTIEEALEIKYEEAWVVCHGCAKDVIWFNAGFALPDGVEGLFQLHVVGACGSCGSGRVWCWDCGYSADLEPQLVFVCGCGHRWWVESGQVECAARGAVDTEATWEVGLYDQEGRRVISDPLTY